METHRITQSLDNDQEPGAQLQPGANLQERYLIQGVIGVGGMGAVYRARDLHFPNVVKLVAIKEMLTRLAIRLYERRSYAISSEKLICWQPSTIAPSHASTIISRSMNDLTSSWSILQVRTWKH